MEHIKKPRDTSEIHRRARLDGKRICRGTTRSGKSCGTVISESNAFDYCGSCLRKITPTRFRAPSP